MLWLFSQKLEFTMESRQSMKKKFSWKANFPSKTDYTAVFQPAVPGILLTERATEISTGAPKQQMDLEVLQALTSGGNTIFKEDNITTFRSMEKKVGHSTTDVWDIMSCTKYNSTTENLPAREAFGKNKVQLLVQSSMFPWFLSVGAQASPLHKSFCATTPSFHTRKDLSASMGNSLACCRNNCSCDISSMSSQKLLLSRIRNGKAVKTEISCTLQGHLKQIWSFIFNVIPSYWSIKAQQVCASLHD